MMRGSFSAGPFFSFPPLGPIRGTPAICLALHDRGRRSMDRFSPLSGCAEEGEEFFVRLYNWELITPPLFWVFCVPQRNG